MFFRSRRYFDGKDTLNFEGMRSKIYEQRDQRSDTAALWFVHGFSGVVIGFFVQFMVFMDWHFLQFRNYIFNEFLNTQSKIYSGFSFGYFVSGNVILPMIGVCIIVFLSPASSGRGIMGTVAWMNGINVPALLNIQTLFAKVFASILAVSGGLCVGFIEPICDIGAIIGATTCYIPSPSFTFMQTEYVKRQLMAAGAAAGIACCFGAPVGGALFCFEFSQHASVWNKNLFARVCFTSFIAVFTVSILNSLLFNKPLMLQ